MDVKGIHFFSGSRLLSETFITKNMVVGQIDLPVRAR